MQYYYLKKEEYHEKTLFPVVGDIFIMLVNSVIYLFLEEEMRSYTKEFEIKLAERYLCQRRHGIFVEASKEFQLEEKMIWF